MGGVKHITSESQFADEMRAAGGALVVVDFAASWCGPCRMIAPFVDELASRYADVVFMKVMDDDCPELIAANGVRAFPTFQFFIANKRVHEMRGANPGGLEQAVREWKGKAVSSVGFSGTGMALGGDVARTPAEITAARLRAMAASASAPAVGAPSAVVAAAGAAPVKPSPALLAELAEFGFSPNRSHRACVATNNAGIEAALDWLQAHEHDADLDAPIPAAGVVAAAAVTTTVAAPVPTPAPAAAAAAAAAGSGTGAGVSASEGALSGLTDEEAEALAVAGEMTTDGGEGGEKRKMTLTEVQELLERRRAEKAAKAKEDERLAEIKRREEGRMAQDMAEDIIAIQRKLEHEKQRIEREAKEKERKRLQIELLRDKIERHRDATGTVPADLMDQLAVLEGLKAPPPPKELPPAEAMRAAMSALKVYGLAGRVAAETVRTLCSNALANPGVAKFRHINLDNEKIKERISSKVGGLGLLKSAGWVKSATEHAMVLPAEADDALLRLAVSEINSALETGLL